ncbi:cyclin-like protein [Pelagophyceae sp. CCMP2097]|nr:cyclin-like protein [Pelagophyceae sp. CCMP2097]
MSADLGDEDEPQGTLLALSVLENSPSRQDGISQAVEIERRIWACELVQEAGILLKLPQVVMCTAQNLVHRFLYRKSLARFDAFTVAMGCFFLACKIEEKPKRIRETLFAFDFIWKRRTAQATEGKLELGGARYNAWKAELVKMERHVLKELGFSFYIIDHAHKFILFYIKFLDGDRALAQKAWSYLNDSMRLDVCLRHRAEVIACAAIFMGARALGIKLVVEEGWGWWDVFNVEKDEFFAASIVVPSTLVGIPIGLSF